MFPYKLNHQLLTLCGLLLLAATCNKNQNIDKLIENDNREALTQYRDEIQKELQQLEEKAQVIDTYLKSKSDGQQLTLVTVDTVRHSLFKHYIEVQGDLKTDENILLYSEISGVIESLPVKKGQRVNKGQILAVLDDGGLSSQLAQLQSQESLAKTLFERQGRLWEENIGSEIQYLEAESNYTSAKNAVKQIQRQINKSTIRAPFAGVIDELLVEQGELSMPGQTPLLRLVSLNNLYIDATIPENYLAAVKTGSEVEVEIRSINESFSSEVVQVGSHINPENRTFKTRVQIPARIDLARPNQIAIVRVNDYTNKEALVIPNNIIQVNAQGESYIYVYVNDEKDNAIVKRRMIKPGRSQDNMTEIISGLESGDIIVLDGARSIRDGESVRLQNKIGK